jgi:GT2 family glycosyltransferase
MISIVYCTRNKNDEHFKHLKESCGLKDVEIIEYINHGESLTKFYNKGLVDSKHQIVVFLHDDITIQTKNWGKKILNHFESSEYGILGVAGTTHMSETGRWWEDTTKMMGQVRHSHQGKSWDSLYSSNFGDEILESVIVDGLFFCVDKGRIKNNFDELVEGFHFYEIDFITQNHLNGVKIGVISNIKITHKSIGQTNQQWEENRLKYVDKFKQHLPFSVPGNIFVKSKTPILKKTPKVSVIIPTKGNVDLLIKCVDSIYEKDSYPNIKIYIADTGSSDLEKNRIKEEIILKHSLYSDRVREIILLEYDYYNFAKINNDVVKNHIDLDTDILLFSNNDIELYNNAISRMVDIFNKNKNVGTVGSRLYYADGTIQHSGVIAFIGQDRRIGLSHKGLKSYYNHHTNNKEVFGNTAAFMMIKKNIFNIIGGFNENYIECFEDVELNVECLNRSLKNIFAADAICYHYESQTRNADPKKLTKESEDYMKRIIPFILKSKKCYNYFENISAKDLEFIINRTLTKQTLK